MRLLLIAGATMLSASSGALALDMSSNPSLDYCLRKNALVLGNGNGEDAGTVVDAAWSKCTSELESASSEAAYLVKMNAMGRENDRYYGRTPHDAFPGATSVSALMARWKDAARSKAIAALLEARASKKDSQ